MKNLISVRGARTHNLKNIDLDIPRDRLVVITGISGSGKSSLAFDTLYAEGQRRYVESLSAYARQFLSMMEKPDVDLIEGLSPAISIEQKSASHNPRSTVGTITEIHDYLRLLFARVGEPRCPDHGLNLGGRTISQMVDEILKLPDARRLMLLAPVIRERKGEHLHLFEELRRGGFARVRVDGIVVDLDQTPTLDKKRKHNIEVVVDRFRPRSDNASRIAESLETALAAGGQLAMVTPLEDAGETLSFSSRYACPECGYSLDELEPRLFSFNNPVGACATCDGLGVYRRIDERLLLKPELSLNEGAIGGWDRRRPFNFQMLKSVAKHLDIDMDKPFAKLPAKRRKRLLHDGTGDERIELRHVTHAGRVYSRKRRFNGIIPFMEERYRETDSEQQREELEKYMDEQPCEDCGGARLRREARHVFLDDRTLPELGALTIADACAFFQSRNFSGQRRQIADKILREINNRLSFLDDVGLGYLSLDRSAHTLSGGEAQRIRLASQIGAGLMGVMYILDEPSIGLHQRDNARLLETLTRLRDLGNTVLIVEHDEEAIRAADHVVDIGPGAGVHGGEVVANGTPEEIIKHKSSLTGDYLSGRKSIAPPLERAPARDDAMLRLRGAGGNNLRKVDLELPLGLFVCVSGVSGSGKSTLINNTLYPVLAAELNGNRQLRPMPYDSIEGLEHLDKCIEIDQSPIGRTPRSNPATYTGLFQPVRELFAATELARTRGYKPGRFSFNVRGGRCEACQGDGLQRVEMHFLPDIYVLCDACRGKRYNRETLEVIYKHKNIHEVLEMTVAEALEFFEALPALARKLRTMVDVGLSYLRLGQSATTLSGGEAQRMKLSRELSKRDTGSTLYVLDEPTTGLHFDDVRRLLDVLRALQSRGNTVVVIEHNLDVIKCADWIIDMGPEGGAEGGRIIASGTPEELSRDKRSHTGRFLRKTLPDTKSGKRARLKSGREKPATRG